MTLPDLPKILETPHHFWVGSVDLPYTTSDKTEVKHLSDDLVLVTKTFVAREYKYSPNEEPYDFPKPTAQDKQSES